jgi:uncharacterized membrane protein YciS (DUF1049 family)
MRNPVGRFDFVVTTVLLIFLAGMVAGWVLCSLFSSPVIDLLWQNNSGP